MSTALASRSKDASFGNSPATRVAAATALGLALSGRGFDFAAEVRRGLNYQITTPAMDSFLRIP